MLEKHFEPSGSCPLAHPSHKWALVFMEVMFLLMNGAMVLGLPHTSRAFLFELPLLVGSLFFAVVIWKEYQILAPYRLDWDERSLTVTGPDDVQTIAWRDVASVERTQPYPGFNFRLGIRLTATDGHRVEFPLPYAYRLRSVLVHYGGEKVPPNLWPRRG